MSANKLTREGEILGGGVVIRIMAEAAESALMPTNTCSCAQIAKRRTNSGLAAEVKPQMQEELPAEEEVPATAPGSWCGFCGGVQIFLALALPTDHLCFCGARARGLLTCTCAVC